jgi:hypothetical protein
MAWGDGSCATLCCRSQSVPGRQDGSNTGRSPMARGTRRIDPLLPLKIGPVNEREARGSGLRLKTSVARVRSFRDLGPRPNSLSRLSQRRTRMSAIRVISTEFMLRSRRARWLQCSYFARTTLNNVSNDLLDREAARLFVWRHDRRNISKHCLREALCQSAGCNAGVRNWSVGTKRTCNLVFRKKGPDLPRSRRNVARREGANYRIA